MNWPTVASVLAEADAIALAKPTEQAAERATTEVDEPT